MQGYLFSKLASLQETTAAAFPIPFVARCPRLWQGTRNRDLPCCPQDIPAQTTGTVHLATEPPTPSSSPPSPLLVPQHSQNMHQNTTFASRNELIPGSPAPESELPAPATPASPLAAGYASGELGHGAGAESLSPSPSATEAGISPLPHQVSRPDWLHGGCHLVASRCIISPAIITVPWALTGDGTTSSCLLLKSGGSKPVHPGAEGAEHARLSCKRHGFGATQAPSQLLQAASSGFLFKGGSAPLPQSHCGSAGTCANPLPSMSHHSLS